MKKSFTFVAGILVGAIVFGGATAIAAGIVAKPTASKVLVNGEEVKLTAYNISDNNYFKLRDIGNELDFSVVWDGKNQRILIDTSRGYDPDEQYVPAPSETLSPTAPPTQTPSPSQTTDIDVYEYAAEVVRYTNVERAKEGLAPLKQSDALTEAAMIKSQDMVDNNYVGHDSPVFGRTESIVKLNGWKYQGENVTDAEGIPERVVRTFMVSKGHKENILRADATHIGVGVAIAEDGSFRWTQLFGSNVTE